MNSLHTVSMKSNGEKTRHTSFISLLNLHRRLHFLVGCRHQITFFLHSSVTFFLYVCMCLVTPKNIHYTMDCIQYTVVAAISPQSPL